MQTRPEQGDSPTLRAGFQQVRGALGLVDDEFNYVPGLPGV